MDDEYRYGQAGLSFFAWRKFRFLANLTCFFPGTLIEEIVCLVLPVRLLSHIVDFVVLE